MSPILKINDIVQQYPGVQALKGVSLELSPGEIRGLVGENGAGKSTLIRILAGIEMPVSGTINFKNELRNFKSSADSQRSGITVVSQEFRLVPELSVADNVFLGHEHTFRGIISARKTHDEAAKILSTLGLDLAPTTLVSALPVGDQQLVEIARALSREFDLLIMDEPTAALNKTEVKKLHRIVRNLANQGKAVIYVSHHLEEIFDLCDSVSVLRDGSLISTSSTKEISEDKLVEQMLGHSPESFQRDEATKGRGEVVLSVRDAQIPGVDERQSFELHRSEILGFAGLAGSGRTQIMRAIFGELPLLGGELKIRGKVFKFRNNYDALDAGIFMLPEDRKAKGIVPHLNVLENVVLAKDKSELSLLEKMFPIKSNEASVFKELRDAMNIRVSSGKQLISQLSGGNQQKALFGRASLSGCSILVLNEPTRGVDIGAKAEIYDLIRQLADSGVSVIVSSSDVPELVSICDRCLVYFGGHLTAELNESEITETSVVAASIGQKMEGGNVI